MNNQLAEVLPICEQLFALPQFDDETLDVCEAALGSEELQGEFFALKGLQSSEVTTIDPNYALNYYVLKEALINLEYYLHIDLAQVVYFKSHVLGLFKLQLHILIMFLFYLNSTSFLNFNFIFKVGDL